MNTVFLNGRFQKKTTHRFERKLSSIGPMLIVKNEPTFCKYLVYQSLYSLLEKKKPLQVEETVHFVKYSKLLPKLTTQTPS